MKLNKIWFLPLAVVVLICLNGWMGYGQKAFSSRVVWEYKLEAARGLSAEAQLNEYGAQGWELVAVERSGDFLYFFLKRAK